ncbi:MAG: AlpA family phage regulatory protein [Deltaproteobacteria bacterium]|jgi:predicted DNA-binding transcriptional regulator AlpA|nr:AlpA family phage regulatory protein [Deltaproteobacteria bacterium]
MSENESNVPDRLIRAKQVSAITGLSHGTVYEYMKRGLLPGSYSIGVKSRAWSLNAINRWVADRKAGIPLAEGRYRTVRAANVREALALLGGNPGNRPIPASSASGPRDARPGYRPPGRN